MHHMVMESEDPGAELLLVLEQLVRFVRQVATADGLSPAASSALRRLLRDGPLRITELANAEGVSQPGMTQLITRLEREGLVRRNASAEDKRGVQVEVTGTGAELIRRRRAERAAMLQRMIESLPLADQAAVTAALPALGRLADAGAQRV